MGKPIAVMKQHGFHEPALPQGSNINEGDPIVVEARSLGISVEEWAGRVQPHNLLVTLRSEIAAVKLAKKNPKWWSTEVGDTTIRYRVRAVLAEKKANDLWHEVSMLKARLKQADNGRGDWVEERDALLTEIDSLRRKAEEPKTEEESVVAQSLRAQVNSLEQALDKAKRSYDETAKAIAAENMELHGKLAEWEEVLEQRQVRIGELEEKLEETVQAYHNSVKQGLLHAERADKAENELAGYKTANHYLVEEKDRLAEDLAKAVSAGLREAPDEVAWLRSRVEYLESKLR